MNAPIARQPHVTQEASPRGFVLRNNHVLVIGSWLFILPNALFASYLSWPSALVLLGGCAASAVLLSRPDPARKHGLLAQPASLGGFLGCAVAALFVVILGGEGHLVYANSDWLVRDAVLADLTRSHDLPSYNILGAVYRLRAPLGMYMVPSAAGLYFGLPAAHFVLALQNAALLGVILYGFYILMPQRRLLAIAVMLAFSGLDIIGYWLPTVGRPAPAWNAFPSHLESWAGYWQYSSALTQFFWVPNHALPGWWLGLLALLCAKGEISIGRLGLSLASTLIWSPLPALGAAPFLLLNFARRPLANGRDATLWGYGAVSLLFLPVAIYLVLQSSTIHHGFVAVGRPLFLASYLRFLLVELLPGILVFFFFSQYEREVRPTIILSAIVLVLLPLYNFGPYNDLVMRGSIPALTVLAFAFARLIANGPSYRRPLWMIVATLACIAALTPAFELARPVIFHRFAISNCSLVSAQSELSGGVVASNYVARAEAFPPWLIRPKAPGRLLTAERRECWPDYPFDPRLFVGDQTTSELLRSRWPR